MQGYINHWVFFRQPNYRLLRHMFCHTYVALHDLVTAYTITHACLQYMLRQRFMSNCLQGNLQFRRGRTIKKQYMLRQRFMSNCLQGNLQLRRGRTIKKHSKALRASTTLSYGDGRTCIK